MITVNFEKYSMTNLSIIDLEIIFLGIKQGGKFDEKDLEQSELNRLEVGRILDQLASLIERELIELNKDGSFGVTSVARHILWDVQIPLGIKILKVLEIKAQSIEKISSFLLLEQKQIQNEIEKLRKRHLVLMSPLRNKIGIQKIYEILPDGIEEIKKTQSQDFQNEPKNINPHVDILSILEKTIEEINGIKEISYGKKNNLIINLKKIKNGLEI